MQTQTSDSINNDGRLIECPSSLSHSIEDADGDSSDARLLYPHVIGIVRRLVSRMGMDRPAVDRVDVSVLLDKFLFANAKSLNSDDFVKSLAQDLDLPEGTNEAEALLNLCQFRDRRAELGQISWKSFVLAYPTLRASGFSDLSALNEALEI